MTLREIQKTIRDLGDSKIAEHSQRFFKTGAGEYGEGDKFLGIRVPVSRKIAKQFRETPLSVIGKLIQSKYHEERLIAVFILTYQFPKADVAGKKAIFEFYLENMQFVNNWDLVDSSAHKIVGEYLKDKSKQLLFDLAKSKDLWERRIAIIANYYDIKRGEFRDTLKISRILLNDTEDLIHKAVGWMLREVGNVERKVLEEFLGKHYSKMPRTMLRYAIEKLPEKRRQLYLKGKV